MKTESLGNNKNSIADSFSLRMYNCISDKDKNKEFWVLTY